MSEFPEDLPAPALADFERMAREAREALPEPFRQHTRGLAIRVADFPPEEVLRELGIDDPYALTGLYDGVALTEKSIMDTPLRPDTVWLFRRPILEEWIERGDVPLGKLVAHVLIHEIAHHFGYSDADIAAIDEWWH